jgi:hypothetical protein
MIDAILASKCHVIVTMRTKTEYREEEYTNARGEKKTKRVKVGLMPVQRAGLEYEFDLIGYMDDENNFVTDKTRCGAYAGRAIGKPKGSDFEPFRVWLAGVQREATPPSDGVVRGTAADQKAVADAKISELKAAAAKPANTNFEMLGAFAELKKKFETELGSTKAYYAVLDRHKLEKSNQIPDIETGKVIFNQMAKELKRLKGEQGIEGAA